LTVKLRFQVSRHSSILYGLAIEETRNGRKENEDGLIFE